MDILYIIIPAYNEEENIGQVIKDWYPIVEKHNGGGKSRLVVIDDGSKDSTYQLMRSYAKNRNMLYVITKKNEGHGATILKGYTYAVDQNADYIFQTDGDGQTTPAEFEVFWEQRKNYDMIIGNRTKRVDGFHRLIVTKILKFIVGCIFHVNILDFNVPYRLMSRNSLKEVLTVIPEKYNLTNVIVSVAYIKMGYRVKNNSITFRQRQGGENSINIKKIIKIGSRAIVSFYNLNKKFNGETHNKKITKRSDKN